MNASCTTPTSTIVAVDLKPAPNSRRHSSNSSSRGMNVSDHALIRWLERNNIIDIQQLRDQLAASLGAACGAADQIRVSEYAIRRDGWKYVIRDHTVITMFSEKKRGRSRPKAAASGGSLLVAVARCSRGSQASSALSRVGVGIVLAQADPLALLLQNLSERIET